MENFPFYKRDMWKTFHVLPLLCFQKNKFNQMKILGETVNFHENLKYSAKRYPVWWAILIVTMLFDIFTTYAFVSKYGLKAEGNLFTKLWMLYIDPFYGNILGKVFQFISVILFVGLHQRLGNIFLLFIILLNCWAIVINSMSLVI